MPVHCTFTLSRADFLALHKVISRRLTQISGANTKLFFANLVAWVPLGIAFAAYTALFWKHPGLSRDLAIVAAAFVVGVTLLLGGALLKQRIYRGVMLSSDSWFLAQQTVALDPEGLTAQGAYGEVRYPWSSVGHLAEDSTNLYLFIDHTQAFVLPKAALGSSDRKTQVKAWLRS